MKTLSSILLASVLLILCSCKHFDSAPELRIPKGETYLVHVGRNSGGELILVVGCAAVTIKKEDPYYTRVVGKVGEIATNDSKILIDALKPFEDYLRRNNLAIY